MFAGRGTATTTARAHGAALRRAAGSIAAALAAVAISAVPAQAADGSIDFGFGTAGDGFARLSQIAHDTPARTVNDLLARGSNDLVEGSIAADGTIRLVTFSRDAGTPGTPVMTGVPSDGAGAIGLYDNDVVVLGGAGGKPVLKRFHADGTPDATFNSNAASTAPSIGVKSGSTYLTLNAADLLQVGTKLYALLSPRHNTSSTTNSDNFVVLRFSSDGKLDTSYGYRGAAGSTSSGIDLGQGEFGEGLAADAAGNLLVGGTQRPSTTGTPRGFVARLTPGGVLDTTYGAGGWRRVDGYSAVKGTEIADFTATADGTGYLLRNEGTNEAYVTRLTPAGGIDATYGGATRAKVLSTATAGGQAGAIAVDGTGRAIVAGTLRASSPTRNQWAWTRLTAGGLPDPSFAPGGTSTGTTTTCSSTTGTEQFVSGVALADGAIYTGGRCPGLDTAAAVKLFNRPGIAGPTTLDVSPATGAAGHEVTRHENFPAQALTLDAADGQAAAFRSGAFRSGAFRSGAFRSGAFRSGAFRSGAFRSGSIARAIPLSDIPLADPTGANPDLSWPWVLAGVIDRPLETITLADVFAARDAAAATSTFAQRFDNLHLDEADLTRAGLGELSLASIFLDIPLNRVAPPAGGWCAFLSGQPRNCSNGVDLAVTNMAELEFLGDDLSAFLDDPIPLIAPTQLGTGASQAFVARFALTDVDLGMTPLGAIKAHDAAALLPGCSAADCGSGSTSTLADVQRANPTGFSTSTLGELIALVASGGSPDVRTVSLADVLPGILIQEGYAVESLSAAGTEALLDRADVRDRTRGSSTTDLHTATLSFTLDCDQRNAGDLEIRFTLPHGFRPKPGSATAQTGGGDAVSIGDGVRSGDDVVFADSHPAGSDPFILPICRSAAPGARPTVTVKLDVEPSALLGPAGAISARATLTADGASQSVAATGPATTVDDSHDTDAGDPANAQRVDPNDVYTGHISKAGDLDYFKMPIDPDLPVGTRITFTVSHADIDDDLVVLGPQDGVPALAFRSGAFRSGAFRSGAFRSGGLPDSSAEPGAEAGDLEPNTLQDVPIPELAGNIVRATSIRRGTSAESATMVVADGDRGKTVTAQVSGYNRGSSDQPYVLRARIAPPPPPKPCIAARTGLNAGATGAFPALPLPSGTQTLILLDQQRLRNLYPSADIAGLVTKLQAYAARAEVRGVVVPVEADPSATSDATRDVRGAMSDWDADPCSVAKADAVVARINAVVDHVRAGLTDLRNVVLVGDDDALPQGRTQDLTQEANESGEADFVALGGKDNPISRALREGNVLTDDSYGDLLPRAALAGQAFVPQLAVGRLVETPASIAAQLDDYTAADGRLNPQTARVTGYDFFADSAQAELSALTAKVPAGGASSLITTGPSPWTAAQALSMANASGPAYLALNAHYTENEAQPASNFYGADNGVISSAQVSVPPRSVVFTMGCHAGLSLPDGLGFVSGDPTDPGADWPQRYGSLKSVYVASTGFGLGDSDVNAYTERLLTEYAQRIGPATNIGQALMLAKQQYTAEGLVDGPLPPLDAKASEQAAFFGLPTYRIGPSGTSASPGTPVTTGTEPSAITLRSSAFDSGTIDNQKRSGPRGDWYVVHRGGADELPLVAQGRPIQPRMSTDVTASDGLPVHGLLITSLASTDIDGVNPAVADARASNGPSGELEPPLRSVFFPAGLQGISDQVQANGRRDVLTLATGQFRAGFTTDGKGTQRLYSRIAGELKRSDSLDFDPATITSFSGTLSDGVAAFDVRTSATDAVRAVVLYRTDAGAGWNFAELPARGGGRFFGGDGLPTGATRVTEAFFEMQDAAGNVSITWNKGPGLAVAAGAVSTGDPSVVVVAPTTPPVNGFYATAPTVKIDPGDHAGATFTYTIDGEDTPHDYTGPFTVSGDGTHVITVFGSDGSFAIRTVRIDTTAPEISASVSPAPNAAGWNNGPVTIHYTCSDSFSGVDSCPADRTVTTEGANQQFTATATDRAGNTRSVTTTLSIDATKPGGSITNPDPGAVIGLLLNQTLNGTATDDRSGVDRVIVRWTADLLGNDATTQAALTCNAPRTSCTWSAPPPGIGLYSVTAQTVDIAGNSGAESASTQVTVALP